MTRRCLALSLALAAAPASAMMANPNPITVTQPDGSEVTLRLHGDEHFHFQTTADGARTVVRGADKWYSYAEVDSKGELAASALRVGVEADDKAAAAGIKERKLPSPTAIERKRSKMLRTLKPREKGAGHGRRLVETTGTLKTLKNLVVNMISKMFPTLKPREKSAGHGRRLAESTGTLKNLVVNVMFADHTTRTMPSVGDIHVLMNSQAADADLAPTGSVWSVFNESSYGTLDVVSTIAPWVTVSGPESYYADGDSGTYLLGEGLAEALSLLDNMTFAERGFEWADFDNDGDGYIDAIAFLHSGYAAEFGGTDAYGAAQEDRIWSHKWSLNDGSYYTPWTSTDDTLTVMDYHISPALWATSGSDIGRIGVIAHETGHFLGLPDLYDTSYEGSGIGSHCIMANSWGWSGTQYYPPAFSAWTKMQLGWSAVETITAGGDFSLTQSYSSNKLYKIVSPLSDTEYFLIENRQAAGYDVDYAAPGLAIWHIDDAKDEDYPIDSTGNSEGGYPGQSGWPANGKHYQVALVQADGNYDLEMGYSGDSGDLWSDSAAGLGPSDAAPSLAEGPFPNTDAYQVGFQGTTGLTISGISTSGAVMTFSVALYTGTCYKGSSMVEVLRGGMGASLELSQVHVGDMVRVSSPGQVPAYAKVLDLPRSPSKGSFVGVKTRGADEEDLEAVVTPHHTFPSCFAHGKAMAAKHLKVGDCVNTVNGRRKVRKLNEMAALPGDETFSVELEGTADVLALGGIFTHASPSAHQKKIAVAAAKTHMGKQAKHIVARSAEKSKAHVQKSYKKLRGAKPE